MRTKHRAMAFAAVTGILAASCARDPDVPDPEQSEGRLVRVEGLQNVSAEVTSAGNAAQLPNVLAESARVERPLVDENPITANGAPAKADQPAGWWPALFAEAEVA